jgi:hypothetical protein
MRRAARCCLPVRVQARLRPDLEREQLSGWLRPDSVLLLARWPRLVQLL